jgi:parvulin-like peptidyl-prolyl isomerase
LATLTFKELKGRIAVRRLPLAGVLIIALGTSAYAQIDPMLARVRLTKVEVITQRQFREQIEQLEEQLRQPLSQEQRRQILDALVDEKILLQAADRELIRVSDSELQRALEIYKRDLARQLGRPQPLTDAELRELLTRQGSSIERFTEQVQNKLKIDKLIAKEQKPILESVKRPDESEIRDLYEANRTKYPIVSPEMVRFKQILLVTSGLEAAKAESARKRADQIYRAIQNGESFDKYQEVFLEGQAADRIGGLSFETWRRDDESKRVTYGRDFIETLFSLPAGNRSGVIKSNVGYHIVEVIEKIPFKVLELDDPIPPQNAKTVRQYITETLMQRGQIGAVRRATEALVKELRAEAEIRINEDGLNW